MSPLEASDKVTWAADCKSARVNRYGIGFGQRGFAGNKHYPDLESAQAAYDAMLADLRTVYGTPAKNWTGRFVEERQPIAEGTGVFVSTKFVPLLKSGKRGKTIHSLYLYTITVVPELPEKLSKVLRVPVS